MTVRKSGLGRGLDALIPSEPKPATPGFSQVSVEEIHANPDQPRSRFDDGSLEELASSLLEVGVLQPVIVESGDKGYTLIAGERRWRAAKRAGLATIPAVIRDATGGHTLVEALVENVQRMDLTPLEEARAYQQLLEEYGMTQEAVAARVGKSRPTISNTLRLLQLPGSIQQLVEEGDLSAGHARTLVGMEDERFSVHLAEKAVAEGWSVRQMEDAVRARKGMESRGEASTLGPKVRSLRPVEIIELENRLEEQLGVRVKITYRNQKGKVVISFGSVEELERLYRSITG